MDIIVADSGPLCRLASADALAVLQRPGNRVRMADMTALEAVQQMDQPCAGRLGDWLRTGQESSADHVSVEETMTGRLFVLARQVEPTLCARQTGRTAAIDWLAETVTAAEEQVVVIHEDPWMARIVANQGVGGTAIVVMLEGFLQLTGQKTGSSDPAGRM